MLVSVSADDFQVNSVYSWGNWGLGRSCTYPVPHSREVAEPGSSQRWPEPAAGIRDGARVLTPASNLRCPEPRGGTEGTAGGWGPSCVFLLFHVVPGQLWAPPFCSVSIPNIQPCNSGLQPGVLLGPALGSLRGSLHSRRASWGSHRASCLQDTKT